MDGHIAQVDFLLIQADLVIGAAGSIFTAAIQRQILINRYRRVLRRSSVNIGHAIVQFGNSRCRTISILYRILARDSTVPIIAYATVHLVVQIIDGFHDRGLLIVAAVLCFDFRGQPVGIPHIRGFGHIVDDNLAFRISTSIDDIHGDAVLLLPIRIGLGHDIIRTCLDMLFIGRSGGGSLGIDSLQLAFRSRFRGTIIAIFLRHCFIP